MRGKFTTKTIIIAVITLFVLIAAVTGTVVFLKDSGEASAAQEQEIINDIQQDKIEENSDDTVKEEQNLPELGNEDEQNDNNEGNTNNNNNNNQNANNNNGNNQNTNNNNGNLEEPAPSTVEREKVISETTTLGWKNIGLNQSVNANNLFINYNNLKYKVEYYFDGNIEESSTITVGENSKGKVINTYEERNKVGYKLGKVENLPLTITENEDKNVIKVHYIKDEDQTKEISYTVKYYLDNAEQEKDRKVEKETVWINAEETMTFNASLLNKEYTGYKKVRTNPATIGTTVKNGDVIEVYYGKETYNYTIYYYKDSVSGANLLGRIPGTAKYKTKITADVTKFKPKEGYEFIGNAPSMIIEVDATKNKLNVIYTKLSNLSYIIKYLEKGTNKELKTQTTIPNQKYNDEIKVADISIPQTLTANGKEYKYSNRYSPEAGKIIITTDLNKNIIKLYYERPEIKSEKTSKVTTTAIKAGTAHPGDEITYTIKVWNEGSGAKEVTIVDNKPQGTTIKADSASANSGTVTTTADKVTWKVNVPENTSKTNAKVLTFKAIIANNATGTIKNTATIDGNKGPNDGDGFKVVKPSDITVSKTSSNTSGEVKYGDEIIYTLKAKNNGEESGTVTIKDSDIKELIDNQKVELISSSVDIEKLATGLPVTVNAGETKQITYKVKVIANVAVNIKNRIEVTNGGKVDDSNNEVEVNTVKYVTVNKLRETTTPKNIIIAIDKSGSMIGKDHIKAKKAVQNIIDVIYPNSTSFANNLINTKVIAYAGIRYWFDSVDSCSTIGTANNYESAKDLKDKVGSSIATGEATNLKNTLEYLAKQVDTNVSKENNIIIFVGDGGTGITQGVKWADCINASNALKAVSTVFTVDVGNAQTMKDMASSSDKYSKVNGYNTDGLTQALKKIIDTVTLNTETDPSRKTDNNGYVKLENIDINRAITINSTTYTSKPDCILLQGGKYYLDLKQFGASEKITITYYKTK